MEYRLHCYFTSTNILSDLYKFDNSVVKLINRDKKCEELHCATEKSNIYEIVIESSEDKEIIENIVDLLCCSYTVVSGYNYYICEDVIKQIKPEEEKETVPENEPSQNVEAETKPVPEKQPEAVSM